MAMVGTSLPLKRVVMLTDVRQMIDISRTHLHFPQNVKSFWFRSFSSSTQHSFTESYLVNSCGLSSETALSASRKVQFETPERADSVLAVLRDYGCTNAHISKIVSRFPGLLTSNPDKTLLPKLEFFRSVGFSVLDIASIIVLNPFILRKSLKENIIPYYNFFKSVVMSNENVVRAFKKTFWVSAQILQCNIAPNIATLKEVGVPMSNVKYLVTCHPNLLDTKREKFSSGVNKVIEMGFNPSSLCFVKAVRVSCQLTESLVQHKMEVYRGWGLTDDHIMLMFRLDPYCMTPSEKKIESVLDFLVNEMHWEPADIARYPTVFLRSLEKNIIPRCSVMKVLQIKGLVKKDLCLGILGYGEKYFIDKYVVKYKQEVPELLNLYEGKIHILELDFVSEWARQKKQL